jgi:hypothetical protein
VVQGRQHVLPQRALSGWITDFELIAAEQSPPAGTYRGREGLLEFLRRIFEIPWADLWTLRDGKVTRIEVFTDPADVLRAAGV